MDLQRALAAFLEDCRIGLAAATVSLYERHLSRLVEALRRRDVTDTDDLTPAHLRSYFAELRQAPAAKGPRRTYSAATVHQAWRTVNTWLAWLERQQVLAANPLASVRRPPAPRPVARHISRDQAEALLLASGATTHPERDQAILLLLLDTGLRRAELAALALGDVDLGGRRLTVRLSKMGRGRVVPMSSTTAHALATWLVARPLAGESLFGLLGQGIYQLIRRLARAAGLGRCSVHQLRHTFATYYEGDIYDLARILGHRDVSTTAAIYAHREVQRLVEVHDARSPLVRSAAPAA